MNSMLTSIMNKLKEYNGNDMAMEIFGLNISKHYDVLVVAPGWKPTRIMNEYGAEIITTAVHSYVSGYEVKIGDKLIGWIQTGSGGCNLIDHLIICSELNFDKLIFIGAVGGLKAGIDIGDICTPLYSIEGNMASAYLRENVIEYTPFDKVVPPDKMYMDRIIAAANKKGIDIKFKTVFCTDSISCEYFQLDFIKSFDTDLIEMETASFFHIAKMLEKPAAAFLVVSDNSANGEPLIGKSEIQESKYNYGRKILIPELINIAANMDM